MIKLSREMAIKIKNLLDNWLPPVLRDQAWVFQLVYRLQYGKEFQRVLQFRQLAFLQTPQWYQATYRALDPYTFQTDSDLNTACLQQIARDIQGETVLEVACGRGLLARQLALQTQVTAVDLFIDPHLSKANPQVQWLAGNIECLPFRDGTFDTVVSTHTLEHTLHLAQALGELRRVAKHRLILVLPRERPYEFGFNCHLHFFPYIFSLYALMGSHPGLQVSLLGGDWYLIEDKKNLSRK